jgi:hypothetical protein
LSQQSLAIGALLLNDRIVTTALHFAWASRCPPLAWVRRDRHAAVGAVVPALRHAAPEAWRHVSAWVRAAASLKNAPPRRCSSAPRAIAFLAVLARSRLGGWYFRLQVLEHANTPRARKPTASSRARGARPRPDPRSQGPRARRQRAGVSPRRRARRGRRRIAARSRLSKIVALTPEDLERFEQQRAPARGFRAVTLKLRVG